MDNGLIPPQSIDAERTLLGSILLDNSVLEDIDLEPKYFYKESNRIIFKVILEIRDKNEPVDLITLSDQLRKEGNLERIGGTFYLTGLTDNILSTKNAAKHAGIIIEKHKLRSLIQLGQGLTAKAYQESDITETIREAELCLTDIEMNKNHIDQKQQQLQYFDSLDTPLVNYPSGLKDLDLIIGGFETKNLVILAARPSMGKTALMITIARNLKVRPMIFSLEMSYSQLANRIFSGEFDMDGYAIKKRNPVYIATIVKNIGYLKNFIIDDDTNLSAGILRQKIKSAQKKEPIKIVLVDYLQLMLTHTDGSRNDQISAITRACKLIAKELDVCIIMLSQLSRAVEARANRRPILSDLRDSGAIEQDADMVIFIHGEDVESTNRELLVEKNRDGAVGTCKTLFNHKFTKFYDVEMF